MSYCNCADWVTNIGYIDGPIMNQFNRYGIPYQGKQFKFCPWCSCALEGEAPEGSKFLSQIPSQSFPPSN